MLFYEEIDLLNSTGDLLYFAPERGVLDYLSNSKLDVKTTNYGDTLNPMLDEAVSDYQFDIMNIDQPDQSWDFIICHRVVEHVPDDRRALSELYR